MSGSGNAKGQPLVALLAVLAGWAGGRVATWEAPLVSQDAGAAQHGEAPRPTSTIGFVVDGRTGPQSLPGFVSAAYQAPYPAGAFGSFDGTPMYPQYPVAALAAGLQGGTSLVRMAGPRISLWDPAGTAWGPSALMFRPATGRSMLSNGDIGEMAPRFFAPEAPGLAGVAPVMSGQAAPPVMTVRRRRWSMDAWTLLRHDGAGPLSPGVLPATYGASQSGAVVRYRIDLSSRYRPAVYLRTTSALSGVRDNAIALGLSARPLPSVPVVVSVEGRLADQAGGRSILPAAFAYTELPPIALPGRMQAEAYLQAGYVGGPFATPFADGQMRVDRRLLQLGTVQARIGGGVWGGAQKGAARFDAGPSASIIAPLGRGMFGRMALDWRFRVAGDAQPGSGPAVTLSAGF